MTAAEEKAVLSSADDAVRLQIGSKDGSDKEEKPKEDEGGGVGTFIRIFQYARPIDWAIEFVALIGALASGAAVAVQNIVLGTFITSIMDYMMGNATPEAFRADAAKLALWFVYIGIIRLVTTYMYAALTTYAAYHITRNIRRAYLRAALSQEIAYFDSGTAGSIAMQATSNGKLIQSGIAEKLGVVFQSASTFVAAFIIAFVTQWKLTLILLCIAPTLIVVIGFVATLDAKLEDKILRVHAQAGAFAETVLSSVRNVHAFGLNDRLLARFDAYLNESRALGGRKGKLYGILFSGEYTIIYLGVGLAFWQGIAMIASGEIPDMGKVFTVIMSVIIATIAFTAIAPNTVAFGRAASAAGELFALIDRKSEIDPLDESGEKPGKIEGVLDFEGITFAYPTRPGVKVLENFSLHIPAGKVTALVGASGSGKSTIIGLLERWYNPASGTIKLDGKPLDSLNLHWLRTNARLVQQEPVLFNGTVFENIANGLVGTPLEHSSKEEQRAAIEGAARTAFAHDFISELPQGYDTRIGERGGLLSGGQKQRVAIARSIVSDPKVLYLDEATSALDPHAEGVVQQALDNASKERTTVVIAHRLSTIKNADNIVVMSKGLIIEQGTHDQLIQKNGAYAKMVSAQNLSGKAAKDKDASSTSDDDDDNSSATGQPSKAKELEHTQSIVRYQTTEQQALEALRDRDDFSKYQGAGFIRSVFKMVGETPEIKWVYAVVLVCCILGGGILPGQAILLAQVMNVFSGRQPGGDGSMDVSRGNFISAMFIVLAFGAGGVYYALGFFTNLVAQTINKKMRRELLSLLLKQDLQFFDRAENSVGALTAKLDSNPQALLELMGFNIGIVLIAVFTIIGSSIMALVFSWKLGLVGVFAGLPPMLISGWARIRLETRMDAVADSRFSKSASLASEAVLAIRTVSSLATEGVVLEKYTDELDHAIASTSHTMFHVMVWFSATQAIEFFILALGFWYGCRLVSFGEIDFYKFFISFMGTFFAGQSASQLFSYSSSFTKAMNAANYYFWLQGLKPTVRETSENKDKAPKQGVESYDLQSVRFSYPLRPDHTVLRGVSLAIPPGEFVAFVGASGCGKSTMMGLLERFYDPTKGSIVIDGQDDLRQLNPRLYRRHVSLVQQEPTLYPGSIRDNVAYGVDDYKNGGDVEFGVDVNGGTSTNGVVEGRLASDAEIETALRAANAWDFVASLPEGLNTPCGTSGSQLSGGQRQRIAIARALIRNPRVLLLDEATSALDTESERVVQAALNEAASARGRITISVAHRLSTVRNADRICVFLGGKIAEMGTHDELIAQGGLYTAMCEAQSLDRK